MKPGFLSEQNSYLEGKEYVQEVCAVVVEGFIVVNIIPGAVFLYVGHSP